MVGPHVSPPSVDWAKAILAAPVALNRESCQTAYTKPLTGLTANSGSSSLERTGCPAIVTEPTCWVSMPMAPDHVVPPSVDRITAAVDVDEPWQCCPPWVNGQAPPLFVIRSKPSISTPRPGPVAGTTIWLPIVWSFCPGSKTIRPVL